MLKEELNRIELCGKEYPIKCDLVVLEKIQKEYGDIVKFEDGITGVVPFYEEDGTRNEKKDGNTVPDISMVINGLLWMIKEGVEIDGSGIEPLTKDEIMRQSGLTVNELAIMAYKEFQLSFLSREEREKLKETTKTDGRKKEPKEK